MRGIQGSWVDRERTLGSKYSICELLTLLLLLAGVYRNDWQAPLLRLCVHRIFAILVFLPGDAR
jgi:hypothetical protein